MKKVGCFDYRQLPDQNELFLKYLYRGDQVESFYAAAPDLSLDHLKARARWILRNPPPFPRDRLVALLNGINQEWGASQAVFTNIKKLASPRTVAVVTGQQLGLFGGPAFTVYKAITAIRLAQMLTEEGCPTVPIFWLASDDSDFQEVRSAAFHSTEGKLVSVRYPGPRRNSSRMVGTIRLKAIEECLRRLSEVGVDGEFAGEMLALLRETYSSEGTLRDGLGRWLARVFADQGLILFDALADYKRDLGPVFEVAVRQRSRLVKALREREAGLTRAKLPTQVRVPDTETLLFWIDGGRRYKLECEEDVYRSPTRQSIEFSTRELLNRLNRGPDRLGPNVLLRPILQDCLFPTVTYVGGPSEIAYFSQISAICRFWDREVSVFPRVGLTVVDRKAQRFLNRHGLALSEVLHRRPDQITENILSGQTSPEIRQGFSNLRRRLDEQVDFLRRMVGPDDPTVSEMLDRARRKMLYQANKVEKRLLANQRIRQSDLGRHLDYLASRLCPEGKLQERVVSFSQFYAQEGPGFAQRLMSVVNPFCPNHQVVYL